MHVHILYSSCNMYTCCYNKVDLQLNLVNIKSLITVYWLFASLTANVRIYHVSNSKYCWHEVLKLSVEFSSKEAHLCMKF